jgi:hypothetical protein
VTQLNRALKFKKSWWLLASFFVPFVAALLMSQGSLSKYCQIRSISLVLSIVFVSFRSGMLGLTVACLIYVFWKVDFWLGGPCKPDRRGAGLIYVLGVFLWLAWFSLSQMILIAQDEITPNSLSHETSF